MIQTTINMLFQLLFLVSYAMAAPIEAQTHGNALAYGSGGGVVGLIVLVLDIIIFSTYPHSHHANLTNHSYSRGLEVQPPGFAQVGLVPPRPPLPPSRIDHLLALLQP